MGENDAIKYHEMQDTLEAYRDADRDLRRENNRLRRELSEAKRLIHEMCAIGERMSAQWGGEPDADGE